MPTRFDTHMPEDWFELYSMGRLPSGDVEAFDEHLLLCAECQERLNESDRFVRVMKEAARLAAQPGRQPHWHWQPHAIGALAALALVLLVVIPTYQASIGPEQVVALSAMRGPDTSGAAHALANRPLLLSLDVTELATASVYALDVVDAGGASVWRGSAIPRDNHIAQSVGRLRAGQYWVRLHHTTPSRPLLREFSLVVSAAQKL